MAKASKRRTRPRRRDKRMRKSMLPFTIHNYILFGAGIVVLIFGYIFMSIEPVDSFWSLTLSPIILIFGYLVIIPLSFLYQHKSVKQKAQINPKTPTESELVER